MIKHNFNYKRLKCIDILKGICVLFVIITHFNWSNAKRLQFGFPFWIDTAVTIFLMISGFLYTKSFENRKIKHLEDCYCLKYIIKLIIKFLIPFCVIYFIGLIQDIKNYQNINQNFPIIDTLLSFFAGGSGQGGYYIPILIQFIFIYPIIYWIIKKYNKKGLILILLLNIGYEILKFPFKISIDTYRLIIFRYLFMISYGCYLWFNLLKKENRISYWKLLFTFSIGFIFILGVNYLDYQPVIFTYWSSRSLIASFYVIPLFTIFIYKAKNIKSLILEKIGECSYEIFLFQMLYYKYYESYINCFVGNKVLLLFIDIIICIVLGIIFHYIAIPLTKKVYRKTIKICNLVDS